jgi:hypothetical protein
MRKYKTDSCTFYENSSFEYAHEEGELFVQLHTRSQNNGGTY